MSRWHEFDMAIINNKHKEMGIETVKDSLSMVDLDEIGFFYKNDADDEDLTVLCFKSGDTLEVKDTYINVKRIISGA